MPGSDAREKLLDLLDRKAFDPVLKASPDDDNGEDRKRQLKDVQATTRNTRESYHTYGSAEKVREMFRDDLHSDAAEKVHRHLHDLDLPTLNDVELEFERLADQLGVGH